MTVELWFRKRITINTDPQRRCYDGCNFSEKMVWSEWCLIGPYSPEDAQASAATFKEINPGHEYKIEPLRPDCGYISELRGETR